MEIISLDISGKFAHFRKFYANNTALSYFIPPRTTIMGMLAALLGWEKDSYYEAMASDKIRIGLRILCPLKKSFHRLNFLKILSSSDFRGKKGRIQTPFEIVSGINMGKDDVQYRIYISFFKEGKKTFEEIKIRLQKRNFKYNLTFGTANFSASIEAFRVYTEDEFEVSKENEEHSIIHSAICTSKVKEIEFDKNQKLLVERELIPSDFVGNGNRELATMHAVVYSITKHPIPLVLEGRYYRLLNPEGVEHITFIE